MSTDIPTDGPQHDDFLQAKGENADKDTITYVYEMDRKYRIPELAALLENIVINSFSQTEDARFNEMHALALRLATQSKTVCAIYGSNNVLLQPQNVCDYASIFIIIRSLMEVFCNLYYVFIEPEESEFPFRYLIWDYSGLKQHIQRLTDNPPVYYYDEPLPEDKAKLYEAIRQDIEWGNRHANDLLSQIESRPEFAKLETEIRNDVKRGSMVKIAKRGEVFERAGGSIGHLLILYSEYSGYIHGDAFSARTIARFTKQEEVDYKIIFALDELEFMLSASIQWYLAKFPSLRSLEFDPNLTSHIQGVLQQEAKRYTQYRELKNATTTP